MRTHAKQFRMWLALALALVACSALATPATSYYIYDESGHVIAEYDANGNPVQEHIYMGDRPVAVVQTTTTNGVQSSTLDYVTTDHQNTPRMITDAQQNVVWTWNGDPFGNGQPTGSLPYNLRFPGQYYDAETGHNYNYRRDYDAATGRYIESDPIGLDGGVNTFAYVSNNPANLIDLYGLCQQQNQQNNTPATVPAASPTTPSPQAPETTAHCIQRVLSEVYGDNEASAIEFFTATNLLPSVGPYQGNPSYASADEAVAGKYALVNAAPVAGALLQNKSIVSSTATQLAGALLQGGGVAARDLLEGLLAPVTAAATLAHDYAVGVCAGAW